MLKILSAMDFNLLISQFSMMISLKLNMEKWSSILRFSIDWFSKSVSWFHL